MAGGSSYELEIGTWQAVLRRPPLGPVAAKVALYLYGGNKENAASILKTSLTGQMLMQEDLEEDILYSASRGMIEVVPEFENGKMIVKGDKKIDY